ncbi:MAG: hypothetical protein ACRBBR_05010 [Cellvibrionaceae bacterium]
MYKKISIVLLSILISVSCGTVSNSIPEDYVGATATITDTYKSGGRAKARIFYVDSIDSKKIYNAVNATQAASYGSKLRAAGAEREVTVKPLTIKIVGTVYSAAPIVAMFNAGANYRVEGEIEFTPLANARYLVRGKLGKEKSAVWIEDIDGNVVSSIVGNMSKEELTKSNHNIAKDSSKYRETTFSNIQNGESKSLILAKLGQPSKILEGRKNIISGYISRLRYIYDDLGAIYLDGANPDSLFVSRVVVKRKVILKDINEIRESLDKSNAEQLQRIAREHSRNKESRPEALDAFAQKAWEESNSDDKYIIDAAATFCNILGASDNPRYKKVLGLIYENAKSKKLKRYAKKNYDRIQQDVSVSSYQVK